MTDIVARLRAMSRYEHDDLSVGDEAAEEIERLRALSLCGCGDQFTAHDAGTCGACVAGMSAADEIAHLRSALEHIVRAMGCAFEWGDALDTAREALKETT